MIYPFYLFCYPLVKKCQKIIIHIFKKIFLKRRPLSSEPRKKNRFLISFLKKLKTDIFKNVKNRKKIFGIGIKNLFFLENIFFIFIFYFLFFIFLQIIFNKLHYP